MVLINKCIGLTREPMFQISMTQVFVGECFHFLTLKNFFGFQVKFVGALKEKIVQRHRFHPLPNFPRCRTMSPPLTRQIPCNKGEIDAMMALYVSFFYKTTFTSNATVQEYIMYSVRSSSGERFWLLHPYWWKCNLTLDAQARDKTITMHVTQTLEDVTMEEINSVPQRRADIISSSKTCIRRRARQHSLQPTEIDADVRRGSVKVNCKVRSLIVWILMANTIHDGKYCHQLQKQCSTWSEILLRSGGQNQL